MWKNLQTLPMRTSIITWPIFYLLVFFAYFYIYPIQFHSRNLINWDDTLSGYFYVSVFLFISIFSGHILLSARRFEFLIKEENPFNWIDFTLMGVGLSLIDWLCLPMSHQVTVSLICFYSLSFMHFWRQKNLQLFFFTFLFFSFLLVFFSPLQLFTAFPTEIWSINTYFHPMPFILPFVILYVVFQFSLKLTHKIFAD